MCVCVPVRPHVCMCACVYIDLPQVPCAVSLGTKTGRRPGWEQTFLVDSGCPPHSSHICLL